jgi:hypothetical protein
MAAAFLALLIHHGRDESKHRFSVTLKFEGTDAQGTDAPVAGRRGRENPKATSKNTSEKPPIAGENLLDLYPPSVAK